MILQRLPLALGNFIDSRISDMVSVSTRVSFMTTYPEDDKHIWRQFRRGCIRSGIKSENIKRYSPELERFFEGFVSGGKEDEGFARLGGHAGKEEIISTHQQRSTFSNRIGQREEHAFQAVTAAVTSNHETTELAHMNGASVTRKPTEPIEHNGEEPPINRKYQAYVESDDESEHAESIGRSCEKRPDTTLEASTPQWTSNTILSPYMALLVTLQRLLELLHSKRTLILIKNARLIATKIARATEHHRCLQSPQNVLLQILCLNQTSTKIGTGFGRRQESHKQARRAPERCKGVQLRPIASLVGTGK